MDRARMLDALDARRRWPELRRMVAFGTVGGLNTFVDLFVFGVITHYTRVPPGIANVASFGLGAANSYVLNSVFTFGGLRRRTFSTATLVRFAAVTGLCILLSSGAITGLVALGLPPLAAKTASLLVTASIGYALNRLYAFRDSAPAPVQATASPSA